jgi:hypothetical protein
VARSLATRHTCGVGLAGPWLAYKGSILSGQYPSPLFLRPLTNAPNRKTRHVVFHLFVRHCHSFTLSSRWITRIDPLVGLRTLVRESEFPMAGVKIEHRRLETARKTTIHLFRSQPKWIRVPVGPGRYIPGKYLPRVRNSLMGQRNPSAYILDSRWDFFTGADPTK